MKARLLGSVCFAFALFQLPAHAEVQDVALSADEFAALTTDKAFRVVASDGKTFDHLFNASGKATVSNFYNDVGTWRPRGANGYCVQWNKQPKNERCYSVVRREAKLALLREDGTFAAWVTAKD